MNTYLISCLLLVLSLMGCVPVDARAPQSSPTPLTASAPASVRLIPARLGTHSLQVELAISEAEQQKGLMFRRELPADQGMLFVFEREQRLSFWMKNTYLPLSIAFLNSALEIVDIQDMQPLDETPHISPKSARYALEMNQGWFSRHQISPGMRLEISLPAPAR